MAANSGGIVIMPKLYLVNIEAKANKDNVIKTLGDLRSEKVIFDRYTIIVDVIKTASGSIMQRSEFVNTIGLLSERTKVKAAPYQAALEPIPDVFKVVLVTYKSKKEYAI